MQHLDLKVIEQALAWSRGGETVWLCTVMSTYGSSPRPPGALFVATRNGRHTGSLSGGCVEDDFIDRISNGEFEQPIATLRYGDGGIQGEGLALPCGGVLDILIERLAPNEESVSYLDTLRDALQGQKSLVLRVNLGSHQRQFADDDGLGARIAHNTDTQDVQIRLSPVARLIIAGISPVSEACAQFATGLGYEVVVCDPREEVLTNFDAPGVKVLAQLPSLFIASGACHAATAVVALTHDPRIDDLAMIEAVRTPAFYIGVMGSKRTSEVRTERLRRSGGLSETEINRLHMPIGLDLGSKTPAEIALAVMADILRVQRGKARNGL